MHAYLAVVLNGRFEVSIRKVFISYLRSFQRFGHAFRVGRLVASDLVKDMLLQSEKWKHFGVSIFAPQVADQLVVLVVGGVLGHDWISFQLG